MTSQGCYSQTRDYRSPNAMPDGPNKSIWGKEQLAWLKRTLLESDADFRVLISPTPIIGPDRVSKIDNHADPKGFWTEGQAFLAWIRDQKLDNSPGMRWPNEPPEGGTPT